MASSVPTATDTDQVCRAQANPMWTSEWWQSPKIATCWLHLGPLLKTPLSRYMFEAQLKSHTIIGDGREQFEITYRCTVWQGTFNFPIWWTQIIFRTGIWHCEHVKSIWLVNSSYLICFISISINNEMKWFVVYFMTIIWTMNYFRVQTNAYQLSVTVLLILSLLTTGFSVLFGWWSGI